MTNAQGYRAMFTSDYMEGAHPEVLKRLTETNLIQTPGYGLDPLSDAARKKIRSACSCPGAAIYFLIGGTQTNAAVIDALLRPYQGVIAADTGHISVHEAGAIEYGGHKVLTLPHENGKLTAQAIRALCDEWARDQNREHIVMPGMVYISHPTEFGTLYSLSELEDISRVCRRFGMPLYLDGARLAYALACPKNDIALSDLAALCDAFYIGGTKCGLLCGEALVVPNPALLPGFFTIMKQHGALTAKGRVLGVQFDALFTDGLYERIGRIAVRAADRIREALAKKGYRFYIESPTNQIFLVLEHEHAAVLAERAGLSFFEGIDSRCGVYRIAASWATTDEDVDSLLEIL